LPVNQTQLEELDRSLPLVVYTLFLRVLTSRLRGNDEAFAFIVFPCFYCLPRAGGDPGYLKKTHHFG
jgi:hypothetical protein